MNDHNAALVFREDRRIALVRFKHFSARIPQNDGASGVKAEVNKEECQLRSDFFCAGDIAAPDRRNGLITRKG